MTAGVAWDNPARDMLRAGSCAVTAACLFSGVMPIYLQVLSDTGQVILPFWVSDSLALRFLYVSFPYRSHIRGNQVEGMPTMYLLLNKILLSRSSMPISLSPCLRSFVFLHLIKPPCGLCLLPSWHTRLFIYLFAFLFIT